MKKIILFISVLFFFPVHQVNSQGCSDAGFCTMGNLKPQSEADTSFNHSASVSFSYGIGEQKTTIYQIISEIEFSFLKNNSIQIKAPYVFVNGNLGSNTGAGDISLSITQTIKYSDTTQLSFTGGIKLPTGSEDTGKDFGFPLPMPYQSTLGTTDLILGASFKHNSWNIAVGLQAILSDENKNQFLRSRFAVPEAQKYFESNQLRRGNDALLRIEKSFSLKKLTLSAGLLNIIHLNAASIVDSAGNRVTVNGSDGLTVNVTGNAQYEISNRTLINFSFGFPTIVRDARPDGLTRKLVLIAGLRFGFR